MLVENLSNLLSYNLTLTWTLVCILFIVLTEIFMVQYSKSTRRRSSLFEFTLGVKFLSMITSAGLLILILMMLYVLFIIVDVILVHYILILQVMGGFMILVLFIWINTLITKKYSKIAEHEHKFKKGQILKAINQRSFCKEGSKTLARYYKYQFVKNDNEYDYIVVRCLSQGSSWYNETRTFKEDCFKKA